jgi:hypothetical protein
VNLITEYIGVPDTTVVVLEKGDYGTYVILYTHQGSTTLEKDEVSTLIERLTQARDKM